MFYFQNLSHLSCFRNLLFPSIPLNFKFRFFCSLYIFSPLLLGKGSERQKSERWKSKKNIESPKRTSKVQKEHQKSKKNIKIWKGSERRKSNLSDFQILMKCQLPMFFLTKWFLTFWSSLKKLLTFWPFDVLIFDVPTPSLLLVQIDF
jgi:hypothetical protein